MSWLRCPKCCYGFPCSEVRLCTVCGRLMTLWWPKAIQLMLPFKDVKE